MMTDYEVVNRHVYPQLRRQEAIERETKGLPPAGEGEGAEPTKGYMLMVMTSVLGMSLKAAEEEYERQKKMSDELKKGKA